MKRFIMIFFILIVVFSTILLSDVLSAEKISVTINNNDEWNIKKIDNVREYKDLQDLKNQEPETYNLLVNMENYRLFVSDK